MLAIGEDRTPFRDLARYARAEGYSFQRVGTPEAALRVIGRGDVGLLVIPLTTERLPEFAWWRDALLNTPRPPRLVALVADPALTVELAPTGVEIVPMPVDRERLADLFRRLQDAEQETVIPLVEDAETAGESKILTRSPEMLAVFAAIAHAAATKSNVLVMGASGTGKEFVAKAIHDLGPRATGPFVTLHAAGIPEPLLERELFGSEKEGPAGTSAPKIGRLERASGGTLFLDEVGEIGASIQGRLLRAIEEREIERVGGTAPIDVDIRLIASTSRDAMDLVGDDGPLRRDLYDRLAVVLIRLPTLSERGDDLLLLTSAFLREFGATHGKQFTGISSRAAEMLQSHEWVGNVRELRQVMERAAVVADGPILRPEHLPEEWRRDSARWREGRRPRTLRDVEMRHIASVLDETRGQIGEAARILGVHRNTLARKIRLYGL